MTIESTLVSLLSSQFSGEFYPDTADDPSAPFCTYQQVGGSSAEFVTNDQPNKRLVRFQFNVWATSRPDASTLMRTLRDTLLADTSLQASAVGELVAEYKEEAPAGAKYGARQDFTFFAVA